MSSDLSPPEDKGGELRLENGFDDIGEGSSKGVSTKQLGRQPAKIRPRNKSEETTPVETGEGAVGGNFAKAEATENSEESDAQPRPLDDATTQLILQLQLEDIRDLEQRRKGKEKEGEITDADLARKVYEEDLMAMRHVLGDRRMARSVGAAVQIDGQTLTSHQAVEMRATEDRRVAFRLDGRAAPSSTEPPPNAEYDDDFISKLGALYVGPADGSMEENSDVNEPGIGCEICGDTVQQGMAANLPCGHPYCTDCLRGLFRASFTDESLFPPRCCQQRITVDIAQEFLTIPDLETFHQKEVEFETPDKTYCCVPTCSTFIPPSKINNDRAVCGACSTVTCSICKAESHKGDCPQDAGTQQLLQVASEQGWQRCFNCKRMIELGFGCYHMTCHCRSQFCYLCGVEWKKCGCDHWDEARLLRRANQIADREADHQQPRGLRVARAMGNLREDCTHTDWRVLRGQLQCEICSEHLTSYVLSCRRCRMHACVRYQRNRL